MQQEITLECSAAARRLIAREGYDLAFGARPLKRAVQRLVQDPLALAILDGDVAPGSAARADEGATGRLQLASENGRPK